MTARRGGDPLQLGRVHDPRVAVRAFDLHGANLALANEAAHRVGVETGTLRCLGDRHGLFPRRICRRRKVVGGRPRRCVHVSNLRATQLAGKRSASANRVSCPVPAPPATVPYRLTSKQTMTTSQPDSTNGVRRYLDALASEAPAPGGGSAAALAGAMGAALISMVGRYTVGRPRFSAVEAPAAAALQEAESLRAELLRLMEEDEAAYQAVAAARRLPRDSDDAKRARSRAIQQATRAAAQPPLAMAAACRRALDLSRIVAEHGNPLLASDAGVAALLAEAALRASIINVRVNLASLRDQAFVAQTEAQLVQVAEGTPSLKEEVLAIAGRRMVEG